jgi:hypothetical protein
MPNQNCLFLLACLTLVLSPMGCGKPNPPEGSSSAEVQELERLRAENAGLPQLRSENAEVRKLRAENQEIHKLRGQYQELLRLRKDNDQLRAQVAKLPSRAGPSRTASQPVAASATQAPQPIANVVQAFAEAAAALEGQEMREIDKPLEGDRILVDTNAIALLIPDLLSTNSGTFEISGWLKSKRVQLKNYQQFNSLGITNYQIQRADPVDPK